jgi:hypothetical protein
MGRISWACASCAQHFTRRFTANKHNRNLHDGKGIIVRILDYIVGRTNGQFLPQDPLAYRREKKNKKNQSLFDSNYRSIESKVIADSTSDLLSYDNKSSQPLKKIPNNVYRSNNKYEKSCYNPNLVSQPKRKAIDNKPLASIDPFHGIAPTKSKLEELNIALNNHYPQRIARKTLALASYHASQGNDDFLEKMLTHLRRHELYCGNSFDNSMAIRHSKSNPPLLDFASLQSKPDNDDEEVSPDALEQARAKLSEIEQVLTPHRSKEFVQNVIKQLTEICNITGSYDILDEALENHKNLVKPFYLRRSNER